MSRQLSMNERRSLASYRGWTTRRSGKPDDCPAADRGAHPALLQYVAMADPARWAKIIRKLGRLS